MEEVRLIDANALHKRIEMNLRASNPFTIEECCYKDALNSVDEAPAIDPESLQSRASWMRPAELKMIIPARKRHEESVLKCSRCGCMISETDYKLWVWDYCPVCGSKMEDETEEQHETD